MYDGVISEAEDGAGGSFASQVSRINYCMNLFHLVYLKK